MHCFLHLFRTLLLITDEFFFSFVDKMFIRNKAVKLTKEALFRRINMLNCICMCVHNKQEKNNRGESSYRRINQVSFFFSVRGIINNKQLFGLQFYLFTAGRYTATIQHRIPRPNITFNLVTGVKLFQSHLNKHVSPKIA